MAEFVKTLDIEKFERLNGLIYVQDVNASIISYAGIVAIIDLDNAMKAGKTCKQWKIYFNKDRNVLGCRALDNFLNGYPLSEFIANLKNGFQYRQEILDMYDINIHEEQLKATQVASPFVKVNKVKLDGKINRIKIAKAIMTGQVKDIICKGRYTDDYVRDDAENFSIGKKADLYEMAQRLLESDHASVYKSDDVYTIAFGTWEYWEVIFA